MREGRAGEEAEDGDMMLASLLLLRFSVSLYLHSPSAKNKNKG
tara:strand:+ start:146 stop:274 length:129 start_codon:yes stop_codon:yes gene_type:complete